MPHTLSHSWGRSVRWLGGKHCGWEILIISFILLLLFSIWGESMCWVGVGIYVNLWPCSFCLLVRAEWLSAASPFAHLSCKVGALSLLLLTPLILVSKPAFWNPGVKIHPSFPNTGRFCLLRQRLAVPFFLHCSTSKYVSQEHLLMVQTFRHLFAPRYEHRHFYFHSLTRLTLFVY